MRMNGNYNGGYGARARDSRGRYMGDYGRRGVAGTGRSSYKAYGYLDDIAEDYGNYNEKRNSNSYGAKQESTKALEYMLRSVCQFVEMLRDDAGSQEEVDLIQEYAQKIGEL